LKKKNGVPRGEGPSAAPGICWGEWGGEEGWADSFRRLIRLTRERLGGELNGLQGRKQKDPESVCGLFRGGGRRIKWGGGTGLRQNGVSIQ